MSQFAVKIRNLGKSYAVFSRHYKHEKSLKNDLSLLLRGKYFTGQIKQNNIWVLKDISLDIKQGEIVGVVGSNGAGKSTFLKLIARIIEPTEGSIEIFGRVGALLEVGAGLHGDLSGRENIFLGGSILGMKRSEIKSRFDEIVAFAEIESYLEMPIKKYSSGMYLRLAFSILAMSHFDTEVLIVDEILAVGDASFQQKCLDKMRKIAGEGRTVIYVSHNLDSVTNLCDRAILLKDGRLIRDGSPSQIINFYQSIATQSLMEAPGIY